MKRRNFIKKTSAATTILPLAGLNAMANPPNKDQGQQIYEWRSYTLKWGGAEALDQYFQQALIPALNKNGVAQVGVFTEYAMPEPEKLHLLIPYAGMEDYIEMPERLLADKMYQKQSTAYHNRPVSQASYDRYDTSLLRAFQGIPVMKTPEKRNQLFEIRTYEGFSEDAVRRKIMMFNEEELPLFEEVGLHPVFFGEMLAGKAMPALTYMLHFENMEERDANWKLFIDHPEWNRMKDLPKYADSVSRIIRTFLLPKTYSQV